MGRGYVVGLLAGALFSSVSVSALSLMMPSAAPVALPARELAEAQPGTGPAVATAPAPEASAVVPTEKAAPEATAPTAPTEAAAEMAPQPAPEVTAPVPAEEPAPEVAAATPPEETPKVVQVPAPEPAAPVAEAPVAENAAPETAAAPQPAPAPVTEASEPATETASLTPRPETPVVEVPAGSEFNRPRPEDIPVVPAPQPAPAAAAAPSVAAPTADTGPALTERAPATAPESPASAPAAPAEPPPQPETVAEAPAAEAAIPVTPPGEAVLPGLAPAAPDAEGTTPADVSPPKIAAAEPAPEAAPDAGTSDESVPEPVAEPLPEPAPGPVAEGVPAPQPQIITPVPEPSPEAGGTIAPAPAAGSAAIKPRIITPGNGRTTENGPVIIDIAPQPPIGAASGPEVGFTRKEVPGVKINRLPRIGVTEPAPETSAEAADMPDATPDSAVRRYAAAFQNPEAKPVIAIVLIDDGSGNAAEADAVSAIGAPVTIALDPEKPGVAVLAQTYRLSGDEIAILAPAMPEGATPGDLETSYQGYVQTLPESVALVAGPGSTLQSDRLIAQHMTSLLATEGRGFVSEMRGLNPGRQAAERAGVAYAGIARSLDEEGSDDAAMRRVLDRAAFDAARSGSIVILGKATPETVAALRGWIEAGQKDAVIGPLSAVLTP